MKRAALYVRVSTQEQKNHGLSIDSQLDALNEYCETNGYTIAGVYNDAGISARKKYTKRPALLQLMADCKQGKFDIVLFTKLDRWFRSVADYYDVQKVLDERKVPWRAIWEDYETETSSGIFKVNIMLSVAQSEADRTSERVKAVNEYRRSQGKFLGQAPHGYDMRKGDLVFNEEHDMIALMFETYLATYSISKTIDTLAAAGYKMYVRTVKAILQNSTYYGRPRGRNTIATCPAYITKEQFDEIQVTFEQRHKQTPNYRYDYLFSGLTVCGVCGKKGCGSASIKKPRKIPYPYYYCIAHKEKYCDNNVTVSERKIEAFLLDSLDSEIQKRRTLTQASTEEDKKAEIQIDKLNKRLLRLSDLYELGDISLDEYKQKRDNIKLQVSSLEAKLQPTHNIELPADWRTAYNSLDFENKSLFWHKIVRSIVINKDRTLELILK